MHAEANGELHTKLFMVDSFDLFNDLLFDNI